MTEISNDSGGGRGLVRERADRREAADLIDHTPDIA